MKREICLGFIIYNSEPSFIDRVKLCVELKYKCYIFDNTPTNELLRKSFKNEDLVHYLTGGKNLGLGIGLSIINAQAYYNGFSSLLFFDQDTVFNKETLMFIEAFYNHNKLSLGNYSSVVFNSKKISSGTINNFDYKDTMLSISSGSLFFLEQLKKINFHDTSFFVDCVDYEFCFNSNKFGFKTGECQNTPGFDHVSEQADKEYSFFGKKMKLRIYPYKRVWGTVFYSLVLLKRALFSFQIKYFLAFTKSIIIYTFFQVLVRILHVFKINK